MFFGRKEVRFIFLEIFFSFLGLKELIDGGKREVYVRSFCVIVSVCLLFWGFFLFGKGG